MELTDLKSIWTAVVTNDKTSYSMAEDEIRKVISKKSKILLSEIVRELKMKRWFLGIIAVVTILLSTSYLLDIDDDFLLDNILSRTEMAMMMFTLGILLLVLFFNVVRSYRQIKSFQESATSLKLALQTSRMLLRRIQKMAIYSDSFAVPVIVCWYLFRKLFGDEPFIWDKRALYIFLASLVSLLFILLVSRALQHRKFGKYIRQLEAHLADLKAIETKKDS